jgi:hypothetical protein
MAPTVPPTATELLADLVVLRALDEAWTDSLADDPVQRHEEGGWIYLDTTTGALLIRRAARGRTSTIDLTNPPTSPGTVVVGKFHTHPNPTAEAWDPEPSAQDQIVDNRHGVPDLIRADDGIHLSGPAERRNGLAGGPGYPP